MDHALTAPEAPAEEAAASRITQRLLGRIGADLADWRPSAACARLRTLADLEGLSGIEELARRAELDPATLARVSVHLAKRPTAWFAGSEFYWVLRQRIAPWLRTYATVRVWVPGEAGGEEAAAIAIVLEEEKLLGRSRVYATGPVDQALEPLRRGRFSAAGMLVGAADYVLAGGHAALERYFSFEGGEAVLDERIRRHIVIGQHNLATDGSLNEFHLIACRRAILDFNDRLTARAHRLFWDSLPPLGVLALPSSHPPPPELDYLVFDKAAGAYRRRC